MKPGIIKTRSSSATSPARQCSLARDSAKGTLMPTKPIPTPSIPTDPSAADLSALVRFFSCTGVDFLESRFNAICQPLFALVFQHPANAQFWIRPQTKLSSDCNPQTGFWATQPGVRDVTSIHIAFFIRRATPTLHQDVPGLRCSGLKRDTSNSSAASASTGLPAASSSGCSKSFQPRMPVLSETTLV